MSKLLKIAGVFILIAVVGFSTFVFSRMSVSVERAAPEKLARLQLAEISKAIEAFKRDCKRYPTEAEGLKALLQKPATCEVWGPDPYLNEMPVDPWGSAFVYELPAPDHFHLISLARDRKLGGGGLDADISSDDL